MSTRDVCLCLGAAMLIAGCASRTATTTTGRYITDDRVGQVAPGNPDARWLLMLFGEPHEKRQTAGESAGESAGEPAGNEVWVWSYRREVERRRRRLRPTDQSIEWYQRNTCVELSPEGAVVDAWVEDTQSAGWNVEWTKVGPVK